MEMTLNTPVFDDATIRSVNFFNGRLLSAEDLTREKQANLAGRKQLGQAIGDGVVHGLEVTQSGTTASPAVTVQRGLAVNRRGRSLELSSDVTLALTRPSSSVSISAASGFGDCAPPQSGAYLVNAGLYLLTMSPAEANEGRSPVSGLGNGAAACNIRFKVEAVQFRLLELSSAVIAEINDAARLRNRLAHRCFGSDAQSTRPFLNNPFSANATSGHLIEQLRLDGALTDCELPLAILHWTTAGLQFVDRWSVRRRITHPSAASQWTALSDQRASIGEAMVQQFQEQLAEITSQRATVKASDRFRYLPAAGYLPIVGASSPAGFDFRQFFSGQPVRQPDYISGCQAEALLKLSLTYPPIDLNRKEVIWLYLVTENAQIGDTGGSNGFQLFMIFASGHIPFQAAPRLDLTRWEYGRYV